MVVLHVVAFQFELKPEGNETRVGSHINKRTYDGASALVSEVVLFSCLVIKEW